MSPPGGPKDEYRSAKRGGRPTSRALLDRAAGVALVLTAVLAGSGASATESIGRAQFELPSPAWELVVEYEHPLTYKTGQVIPLFSKLYRLPGTGAPKALLLVTSTSGSLGARTSWVTDRCPEPRSKFFAADFSTNKLMHSRQCIVVNPAFVAAKFFREAGQPMEGIRQRGIELPRLTYSMRSVVTNENGAFLQVNLMTASNFAGLASVTPDAEDLHGVAPALVAWTEALHDSAKGSLRRVNGNLVLPAVEFTEDK